MKGESESFSLCAFEVAKGGCGTVGSGNGSVFEDWSDVLLVKFKESAGIGPPGLA